jgi:hypothetical protein
MLSRCIVNALYPRSVVFPAVFLWLAANGCGDGGDKKAGGGDSAQAVPGMMCSGASSGACDKKEVAAYGQCVQEACGDQYESCFGPDYRDGTYDGGPCSEYYTCVGKCDCGDSKCQTGCGIAPDDCQRCLASQVQQCVVESSCKEPSCTSTNGGGLSGAKGACDQWKKCCDASTDTSPLGKDLCVMEYNALHSLGDATCQGFLKAFCK